MPRGERDGSLRPYSRFSRQEPLPFYQVAPQLYSRGWMDPVPDPLLLFVVKSGKIAVFLHSTLYVSSNIYCRGISHILMIQANQLEFSLQETKVVSLTCDEVRGDEWSYLIPNPGTGLKLPNPSEPQLFLRSRQSLSYQTFPTIYRNLVFFTVFTRALHSSLSWVTSI
jgi:hypothetical protein